MHAPSKWTIGKHTFRWESPDVLRVKLEGNKSLEEAIRVTALYKELGEVQPFFLLSDMGSAETLDPEARHYFSEHLRHEWLQEVIFFNTRLVHRALARGLILAAELLRAESSPMLERVHFVSTEAKAQSLLVQLRARQGAQRRVA